MDPTNNQIPSSTPNPEPAPVRPPETPVESSNSIPVSHVAPANPVPPIPPSPVAPVGPASPAPVGPVNPVPPISPEPVAPIDPIPTGPVNPVPPVDPTVGSSGADLANPIFQTSGVAATDPIMMPDQPKAPDPVEEELKAPMKAAAPVPGSIGSAVSGPEEAPDNTMNGIPLPDSSQTPSVSFNDPAAQPDPNTQQGTSNVKKKNNKTTLIALIVVAAMVVIALVAVLIFTFKGGDSGNNGSQGNSSNSGSSSENGGSGNIDSNEPGLDDEDNGEGDNNGVVDSDTNAEVVCSTSVFVEEGVVDTEITFKINDGKLDTITTDITASRDDEVIQSTSETKTFDELVAEGGWVGGDDLIFDEEGNLLISSSELAERLTYELNVSGPSEYSYTCTSI